ncbi:MAG: YcxB family protein [Pseudobutyrivibrio sp.]|nr:YcxB family protein [Pseudobutyrivibrio sp.]
MGQNISFSAKISEQDLYKYNMHHAYTSTQGIFSLIVSCLLIVVWIARFNTLSGVYIVAYPVVAVLFALYIPFTLKGKAKLQMQQDVFKFPLDYELTEEAIIISSPSAENPAELPWEYVYKVTIWKDYLLIYTNRINAYIIPKDQITESYDSILAFIKSHVEDYKYTIK